MKSIGDRTGGSFPSDKSGIRTAFPVCLNSETTYGKSNAMADDEFDEKYFDGIREAGRRECLRWWITYRWQLARTWWSIPKSGYESIAEGESDAAWAWRVELHDYLIPVWLLRCRSMFELSYVSGKPYVIRCVANWTGGIYATGVNFAIGQALVEHKHFPKSWPEDMNLVAIIQHDWHYSFPSPYRGLPPLYRGGELIDDSSVMNLPVDEQIDIFYAAYESMLNESGAPRSDSVRINIEGISFDGGQWFGNTEHDLRNDHVGELQYPFGTNTTRENSEPRSETGPFLLQWLRVIFDNDHDATLKKNLGTSLRGSGQTWYVETSRLNLRGNWKEILRKHAETVPKPTRSRIEKFLSLQ